MSESFRVQVFMVGFDKDRAAELKQILKIYHNSQGAAYFRELLRRVWDGERVMVYESNSDQDAIRMGQSILRAGAKVEIDGLQEEKAEF